VKNIKLREDMNRNERKFSVTEKVLIASMIQKIKSADHGKRIIAQITFQDVFRLFTREEKILAQNIMRIKPKQYGFRGCYYGITPVPRNLIIVRYQRYRIGKKIYAIPPQLVPRNAYRAYRKLIAAMKRDIKKTVLIESGYRSPAYQFIIFLLYLKQYQWNIRKTCRRVALPGYSEHGYPKKQALDFVTTDGIPSESNPFAFSETSEYTWLRAYASKFSFSLSYPPHNKWGVMFEPWHWSFKK